MKKSYTKDKQNEKETNRLREEIMNDREYRTGELLKRFLPYYRNHKAVMFMDLFCASLTTICELVLPMIIRRITNTGLQAAASLTVALIGKMSLLYLILKVIECLAN